MYIFEDQIKVYDTDAAGILFFGNIYRFMHNAFEGFLAEKGFPLDEFVNTGEILIPVVHSEADYITPMKAGDNLNIQVSVSKIGHTSFTVDFKFVLDDGTTTATGVLTCVVIDKSQWRKMEVPSDMRKAFLA